MDNTVLKQQDFADAAGTAVTMLVERLFVFLLQLEMIERWISLDKECG